MVDDLGLGWGLCEVGLAEGDPEGDSAGDEEGGEERGLGMGRAPGDGTWRQHSY